MSEFKFACPVCGQHITAHASASGTQLTCPTCFQELIVPQAPASGDSRFIVSAAQVGKPRPLQSEAVWQQAKPIAAPRMSLLSFLLWTFLVCAAAAVVFAFRKEIQKFALERLSRRTVGSNANVPSGTVPIATNVSWTLDLAKATIPEEPVAGGIHGKGFYCERVTLQGGDLTLRQGRTWPPDLGVTVLFFAKHSDQLRGKTVEVGPERTPPLPQVTLRWKDDHEQAHTRNFTSGYALKMVFGQPANARMPGKIFLSLPDEEKSVVAGTFEAEIGKPPPPKTP